MKKKILLTYAMYGNGHRAVAEYIEKYFKQQDPELEILAIDLLKYSTPVIGSLTQKITEDKEKRKKKENVKNHNNGRTNNKGNIH